MKHVIYAILTFLVAQGYSQSAMLEKIEKENGNFLVITIKKKGEPDKSYWPSCYFRDATKLPDSVRLSLIERLLAGIDGDTSVSYKLVEALSYRYKGRHNKLPQSTHYNMQVASLILINYIAFSSDAVEYSPFPVLFNKISKKEFTSSGKALNSVIKEYRKWFKKVERKGFKDYSLPLLNKKYEWYGSLYTKQRKFSKTSVWEKFYDCPVLVKQEEFINNEKLY